MTDQELLLLIAKALRDAAAARGIVLHAEIMDDTIQVGSQNGDGSMSFHRLLVTKIKT